MSRLLASLLLLVITQAPFAAGSPPGPEPFRSLEEAVHAATSYSENSGGVGVVIIYGVGNKVSADALGSSFSGEIERRGFQSQYFVMKGQHDGVGVMFRIGDWNSGSLTVENAAESMGIVVEKAAVQERIVFLRRRMESTRDQLIAQYGEDYLLEMEKRWLANEGG